MLIVGIVAAVVVAGVVVGVLVRRRSQDDVHSVEHYHRKLHTLEEMRAHPAGAGLREGASVGAATGAVSAAGAAATGTTAVGGDAAGANGSAAGDQHANGANGSGTAGALEAPAVEPGEEQEAAEKPAVAYPASTMRVSSSPTVRLTDAEHGPPAPAPPPPVSNLAKAVRFDDAAPDPMPATFMSGNDRAMDSISHRPRRLGGPLAAIAAVAALVVVLIVTGMHTTAPTSSHSHSPAHAGSPAAHPSTTTTTVQAHRPPATSTTVPPVVSGPLLTSAGGATYTVGSATYALVLSATSGPCWIRATDASNSVLFIGTLYAGQSHTITASGPLTVLAGAPSAFTATVNGTPVSLPAGYQAPFTLTFQTPAAPG